MIEWACRKGRAALFEDCGLGKTLQYLAWAENVVRHTNGRVLIMTPLAVSAQTVQEGEKFGIECVRSAGGYPTSKITVTNYEKLHRFDPADFVGVVCDESSIIKDEDGATQKAITEFMLKMRYRLLCTATAAPNDYPELGTSAEALGQLGRMDMLARFFKNDENSLHPKWWGARWRLKKHGELAFWRWVCSWARALRRPSDIGFSDDGFVLPPLNTAEHVVQNNAAFHSQLFAVPAITLQEQREERRLTLDRRCEKVAELINGHTAVAWCHLNVEGDLLERLIPGSRQLKGSMDDAEKEEIYIAFATWQLQRLITKAKMGGMGSNWQHCQHMTTFPSHSFEQYYQTVRRFWRFGQKKPVQVDIITTEGEIGVLKNLQRKAEQADKMFEVLVNEMNNALGIKRSDRHTNEAELPSWL